eukprot:CAMPEP_0197561930 /NCGR_PEP_ID=MMETSP1320-20131121/26092_1 /TAXON_ID=91990 /ORGANISM="Bolidomonas sp., Strain RCC2347" /LENGTH=147 /DNA_ID=CAMNT_0043123621 /DNA_START=36 /DNA_END=476 /DNA_ORIENTATION=+
MDIVNNEQETDQKTDKKTDQMQIDTQNTHHDTTTTQSPQQPLVTTTKTSTKTTTTTKTSTTKTKHNTTLPKEGLIPRSAWQPAELALPVGWTITRHRRGTQGSITSSSAGTGNQSKDFYKHYHNPEGKKFRSFKQCVEFLGLPPSAG